MAVVNWSRRESLVKIAATAIAAMLVISSAAMVEVLITAKPLDTAATGGNF